MDIRDRIRSIIEQNPSMTVRSVSLSAGLSDSMLHKFLKGDTASLTLDTVDKLARALSVDPRWLAYGEGDSSLAGSITDLVARIPERERRRALALLETFAHTGTDG